MGHKRKISNLFLHANEISLVVVLIEDVVAVDNLDAILKVDHIDAFLVAPGDLLRPDQEKIITKFEW